MRSIHTNTAISLSLALVAAFFERFETGICPRDDGQRAPVHVLVDFAGLFEVFFGLFDCWKGYLMLEAFPEGENVAGVYDLSASRPRRMRWCTF